MVVWITGSTGSGKTLVAEALVTVLRNAGKSAVLLDGDNLRWSMHDDLSHTYEDRYRNAERMRNMCLQLDGQVDFIVCSIGLRFPEISRQNFLTLDNYTEFKLDGVRGPLVAIEKNFPPGPDDPPLDKSTHDIEFDSCEPWVIRMPRDLLHVIASSVANRLGVEITYPVARFATTHGNPYRNFPYLGPEFIDVYLIHRERILSTAIQITREGSTWSGYDDWFNDIAQATSKPDINRAATNLEKILLNTFKLPRERRRESLGHLVTETVGAAALVCREIDQNGWEAVSRRTWLRIANAILKSNDAIAFHLPEKLTEQFAIAVYQTFSTELMLIGNLRESQSSSN